MTLVSCQHPSISLVHDEQDNLTEQSESYRDSKSLTMPIGF